MLTLNSTIAMNNGVDIPTLGLGVFRAPEGDETYNAVRSTLDIGYRHIDTAKAYGNEQNVGQAIRDSGLPRQDIFITTKLWNDDQGFDSTLRANAESLRKLGLEYIDLYLVHWPVPGLRLETWRAMERLLAEGKCRAIGVSNYMVQHLEEILGKAHVIPAVNQIELTPYNYLYRKGVVDLCQVNNIVLEAYSPLTKGLRLGDPRLVQLAAKYNKTPAQILIRWVVQQGMVAIPKSTRPERIAENAQIFDFEISESDMGYLETFNENLVTGWGPTNEL